MALSGLPAAGGCFCAALMLALIADSDPGVVYERQPWVGALVAACAACAFAAMVGWATLQRGGLPAPVLLGILALAGVPFALPEGLLVPGASVALVVCAVLATRGLARPPASPRGARRLTAGLAAAALALAVGQALAVGLHDPAPPGALRAAGERRTGEAREARAGRAAAASAAQPRAGDPAARAGARTGGRRRGRSASRRSDRSARRRRALRA